MLAKIESFVTTDCKHIHVAASLCRLVCVSVLTGSLIAKPLTEGDRCPRQLHYHTVMIDECLLVNATVSCPAKPGAQCRLVCHCSASGFQGLSCGAVRE